jgi:hypothetical protein
MSAHTKENLGDGGYKYRGMLIQKTEVGTETGIDLIWRIGEIKWETCVTTGEKFATTDDWFDSAPRLMDAVYMIDQAAKWNAEIS